MLLTLVGGLVGFCYQERTAEAALRAQETEANRASATALYEDLSQLLSRRLLVLQRAVMWVADQRQPFITGEQIAEQRRWYEHASRHRAMLCRFFGPDYTVRLQEIILGLDYVESLRSIERGIITGRHSADSVAPWLPEAAQGVDSLRSRMLSKLDSLAGEVYLLNLDLVDRIRQGDFVSPTAPKCADEEFRSFEKSSSPLWRFRFFVDPMDTLSKPRGRK